MVYSALTDNQLVCISCEGDDGAFAELVARYLPRVRRIAAKYAGPLEAEDLVQEGLLALYRAVKSYQGDRAAAFSTYALRCIENACISALRMHNAGHRIPEGQIAPLEEADDIAASAPSPEQQLVEREHTVSLYRQVRKLLTDLEYRVWVAHLSGFSNADIAAKWEISPKSAENALARARKKLAQFLSAE